MSTAKCDVEYCGRLGDPSLADRRCEFHSADPTKSVAPIEQVIGQMRAGPTAQDCRGWTFPASADFSRIEFRHADFRDARFIDGVEFRGTSFRGRADFTGATFSGVANFDHCQFSDESEPRFTRVRFSSEAAFRSVTWASRAGTRFVEAVFDRGVDFADSRARNLQFLRCTFNGASFTRVSADDALGFWGSAFASTSSFEDTDLTDVQFHHCDAASLALGAARGISNGEFHGMSWPRHLPEETSARQANSAELFRDAERVYREIRRSCERHRQFDDANWADFRELEMRRLARASSGHSLSLLSLYRIFGGYGQRAWIPLAWLAGLLLFLYPMLFTLAGASRNDRDYVLVWPNSFSWEAQLDLWALAFRAAALAPQPPGMTLSPQSQLLEVTLRVAGPFFALLVTLAVRRQFRR